ncbi:hypothetical protein JCM10212_006849 [Sporobolomyces blumeae]
MGIFKPADVRRRTCCFCVPARVGTLGLATLATLLSTTIAIQATVSLFRDNFVNAWMVWVSLAQCVLWWSLTLICVYGWLGCVRQRFEWVEWFYELLWWHVWVNVGFGIYGLILLSLPASKFYRIAVCSRGLLQARLDADLTAVISNEEAAELVNACTITLKKVLLLIDFAWVIAILVELYLCLMTAHYLDELADLDAATRYGVDIESSKPPYEMSATVRPSQTKKRKGAGN